MSNDLTPQETSVEGEVIFNPEEELERVRQVDAVEKGRPFFTVDEKLNPVHAGWTQLIDFDGGAAKGLVFIDKTDSQRYSLGNPSKKQTHHRIVQHADMLKPIHDAGFDLANIVHTRGGSSCFALFRHPEITMPDNTTWDNENYWDGNSRGNDDLLHLSVAAWLSPNTGKSIRAAVGFFRSICANGLVSAILGLGHMRITHNQFTNVRAETFAQNALTSMDNYELQTFSPKVLSWPLHMLDAYQRDEERAIAELPAFARTPFNAALASRPAWFQDSMMYQLNLALQSKHDLSPLDVLNMVTNVSNEADNHNLYFQLESISEAFMRLLEVSAFKQGIEFPADLVVNTNVR